MASCTCTDRRSFLKAAGLTLVISAIDPSLARAAGGGRLRGLSGRQASGNTFVFVFQRFGADGLNTVVPIEAGEYAAYQSYRPSLKLPLSDLAPQQLSADFALHPASRAGLFSLWQQGVLAVLPNVGYPDGSRSHFDSQKFLDSGTPGDKATRDGWLNRYLQALPSDEPLRAISFGSTLPRSLAGPASVLSFFDLSALAVSTDPTQNQKFLDLQAKVYARPPVDRTYDRAILETGSGLIAAIQKVAGQSLPAPAPQPPYAYPATSFGKWMAQLAQLIRSDLFAIEVAEVDLGGWDTHTQQADPFQSLLAQLSDGIAAFVSDLGPARMANTIVCTVSEFGRTARENGNGGTDHGSAWATFVTGGNVQGGIYGTWISLTDLRDDRDLKHSIDFRDVFSEILSRHLGSLTPDIFPDWTYTPVGFL